MPHKTNTSPNYKNATTRAPYTDKAGHVHNGYGAKAARKRDGLIEAHAKYNYGCRQRPGSMKHK